MSEIERVAAHELPVIPVAWADIAVAMDNKYNWPTFNGNYHRVVWTEQIV